MKIDLPEALNNRLVECFQYVQDQMPNKAPVLKYDDWLLAILREAAIQVYNQKLRKELTNGPQEGRQGASDAH